VLFNEPKLLKSVTLAALGWCWVSFSALQRAEIAEIRSARTTGRTRPQVSVLFNEPKLLKSTPRKSGRGRGGVSVLFNEPKLLKCSSSSPHGSSSCVSFSALQRAEIAEIVESV